MISLTSGYIGFQVIVLLLVLGILWKNKGWQTHTNTASSILTIVGVLGTFIGIYLGLREFDAVDLQNSISHLLDGLKHAFSTSIVGIGSSLLLKGIISPFVQMRQGQKEQDPIEKFIQEWQTVETSGDGKLSAQLESLIEVIKNENSDTGTVLGGIVDIRNVLTGEAGATIPTQLQNLLGVVSESRLSKIETALCDDKGNLLTELRFLRQESSKNHWALIKEFQSFSKNVAESVAKLATDELIGALKAVIEDFNAKITEQFGDNFKQLNEAVGKMVTWQDQYRQHMDKLAEEFRVAAESIEISRQSLDLIATRSESIVACTEKLDPILHTLNDQLEAFSKLRERAHDAFPLIEKQLTQLTTEFSGAVQTTIADSHASMNLQRQELTNRFNDLKSAMEVSSNQIQEAVDTTGKEIAEVAKRLEDIVERNKEDMKSHVNTMHEAIGKEVTESIRKLAGYYSSLSEEFVKNYTELIENYGRAVAEMQRALETHQQNL